MISISIADELKHIWPDIALACIEADVQVKEDNPELWKSIIQRCNQIKKEIVFKQISRLPNNKEARAAYRKFGKDPTRYRLSSESLLRRILKNKQINPINNIVDINNLLSLVFFESVGSYDTEKIVSPVTFRKGEKDEEYIGIGRGSLNIENLPVLSDMDGPFGSATSDSERTMVTMRTKKILLNKVSFNGKNNIKQYFDYGRKFLEKYANAKNIKTQIIG